jgi:hypothetical protein
MNCFICTAHGILIFYLAFAVQPGFAATLYVGPDGNDTLACNESNRRTPFSTIYKGVECLCSKPNHPDADCSDGGDTLILLDVPDASPYLLDRSVEIGNDKSGTPAQHTAIKADHRWGAKLVWTRACNRPVGGVLQEAMLRVNNDENGGYVDIEGLDISAQPLKGGYAIAMFGHDNIIRDNYIHDLTCITETKKEDTHVTSNSAVVSSDTYTDQPNRLHVDGNNHILNNVFTDVTSYDADPTDYDGVIKYENRLGVIANNLFVRVGGSAIDLSCHAGGSKDSPLYIVNNTITNHRQGGISWSGSTGPGDKGCGDGPPNLVDFLVVENNIISCGAHPEFASGVYEKDVTGPGGPYQIGDNNVVRNNLTYLPLIADPIACPYTKWWASVAITCKTARNSNPDIVCSDPDGPMVDPPGIGTLTDSPLYVNNTGDRRGDYRLRPISPAVESGGSGSHVPAADLDGTLRPQGSAVDRGAYEFPANRVFRRQHH